MYVNSQGFLICKCMRDWIDKLCKGDWFGKLLKNFPTRVMKSRKLNILTDIIIIYIKCVLTCLYYVWKEIIEWFSIVEIITFTFLYTLYPSILNYVECIIITDILCYNMDHNALKYNCINHIRNINFQGKK